MTTLVGLIDALARSLEAGTDKPVVTFNENIEVMETYIDRGMMARVESIVLDTHYPDAEGGDMYKVVFDVGEFRAHNTVMEQPNYYDGNGVACLTATGAGQYPKDGKETVYLMFRDNVSYCELDDGDKIFVTLDSETIKALRAGLDIMARKLDEVDVPEMKETIARAKEQLKT